ncbi:MAG: transcription antitermination factor NusB [Oscillospiraceae bacterium]
MNRTEAREIAVRLCFEISSKECPADEILAHFFDSEYYDTLAAEDKVFSSYPDERQKEYIEQLVRGIGAHSAELDGYVAKYSRGWQFGRISRTALAVIKTAMYEIMYMPDIPTGVAVNEAVEIAKHYDEPETVSFVNGVLGSFAREELKEI